MESREYIIGLGSNLGSRQANLEAGLELLAATAGCRLGRVSKLYESAPVGPPQPRYFNAAAALESSLSPHTLLAVLLEIEARLGRRRRERWGPRPLDLDVLWAGEPIDDATLSVPHPRLTERAFALGPLLDVAPALEPEYGDRLRELGGAPSVRGTLCEAPSATQFERERGLELSVTTHDFPDAVAAAITALGRSFAAGAQTGSQACEAGEAIVVLARSDAGRELESLFARVLVEMRAGLVITRATVCELEPGRLEARLFGRRTLAPGPWLSLVAVTCEATTAGLHAVFELAKVVGGSREDLAFSREILDR